jgi:Na+/H+ antiporter NhaD/arsenite permease-like protein
MLAHLRLCKWFHLFVRCAGEGQIIMLSKFLGAMLALALMPSAAQAAETAAYSTTPVAQAVVAVLLVGLFVLLIKETFHKTLTAGLVVAVLVILDLVTPLKVMDFDTAVRDVDWNVIFLLGSMMIIVHVLIETRLFDWLTARMIDFSDGRAKPLVGIIASGTGFLSAFADNVTTVLFMAPMARKVSKALGISVWALAMPMIMAANIGGTATLIGDPPNVIIGVEGGLSFMKFIYFLTVPIIFMMIALVAFSFWFYRKEITQAEAREGQAVEQVLLEHPRILKWALGIIALIFLGFFTTGLTHLPVGVVAFMGAMAVMAGRSFILKQQMGTEHATEAFAKSFERGIEWLTLAFFIFMFMAISSAEHTGLIHSAALTLQNLVGWFSTTFGLGLNAKLLTAALLILVFSAVISALVDNIPYTITAVAIVQVLVGAFVKDLTAAGVGDPGLTADVLWWALSLGACLGGNATLIGASANVTTVGIMEKQGERMTFVDFLRFGVPVTVITIAISAVYLTLYVFAGGVATNVTGAIVLVLLAGMAALRWKRKQEVAVPL